ncbi:hypothetical protein Agub_g5595, partial [Astrephomene gubernaculifera]
ASAAAAAAAVGASATPPPPPSPPPPESRSSCSLSAPLAHLGLGLEVFVLACTWHRDPALREVVVGMLPGVMRLQELAGPQLQKFAPGFQAALLLARCLSLNTHTPTPAPPAAPASAVPSTSTMVPGSGSSGAASGGLAAPPPSHPHLQTYPHPHHHPLVSAALGAVCTAAEVAVPWSARAAALSYAQTLWFRHAPLLSEEQLRRLQDVVVSRLSDPRSQVRSLAAATLSGLLRGAAPGDVQALRSRLLIQAAELFGGGGGGGRRRRGAASATASAGAAGAPAAGAAAPLLPPRAAPPSSLSSSSSPQQQLQLAKLGCVAGLSALLMSCPYDVPGWLPPVLMALVRAATATAGGGGRGGGGGGGGGDAGVVRAEAGRVLGEFRRTHEAEALEKLKGAMQADDWDSFTQATGTASYFV